MSEPQGSRRGGYSWIRSNILGLVAIFIALSGSAVATQVATKQNATSVATKQGATASKIKRGPRGRPGPPGPQGIPGAAGVLTGAAGGDLTGNYPNPQIAPEAVGPAETGIVPAVTAFNFGDTSVPTGTGATTLHFDSESFDTAEMHDIATNSQNLTAPIDGTYLVEATIQWPTPNPDSAAVGIRKIVIPGILFGGPDVQLAIAPDNTVNHIAVLVQMFAGDSLHINATQTSGVSLTPAGSFSMVWVGPLAPA